MATYETLIVERRGAVEWITLNRPERLNAISAGMATELADLMASLQDDLSVRVVVLRGSGRAFCSGLDVKDRAEGHGDVDRLPEVVLGIRSCPQVVLALVHGPACGGGFAIALAADIRIAGESARMNDAFINLGLSGCELGLSYFLPRYVGLSVAAELMYTGRFIDAQRALQTGLVSAVVPDDNLESAANDLVRDLLRVAPLALRSTKATLARAIAETSVRDVIEMEAATQRECMNGPDFDEGMLAIIEKRPPRFGS